MFAKSTEAAAIRLSCTHPKLMLSTGCSAGSQRSLAEIDGSLALLAKGIDGDDLGLALGRRCLQRGMRRWLAWL